MDKEGHTLDPRGGIRGYTAGIGAAGGASGAHAPEAPAHRLAGLCASCEHRIDCTFPPVAGGVWRCEEFV